jgi:hypothetical protein
MKRIYLPLMLLCLSTCAFAFTHTYPAADKHCLNKHAVINVSHDSIPLPVILLDFQATIVTYDAVRLSWLTATEKDNQYFIVERSADGVEFEKVAQIQAAGNSKHIIQYEFTETYPLDNPIYYRLKQVNTQGKITYSKPVNASYKTNTATFTK